MVLLGEKAETFWISLYHRTMCSSLDLEKGYCDRVVGLCLKIMDDLLEQGAPEDDLFQ